MSSKSKTNDEIKEISYLIELSLREKRSGLGGGDGFTPQARKYLVERHMSLAPGKPIELPSGASFLVMLVSNNMMDEAMEWEDKVREIAWAGTSDHPYPIESILDFVDMSKNNIYSRSSTPQWPKTSRSKSELKSFLIRGLIHSMPWREGREKNSARAQSKVVEFLQTDDQTLDAQTKLKLFAKAQGMPAFFPNGGFASYKVDWKAWIEAGLLEKDAKIALVSPKTPQLPWIKAWLHDLGDHKEVLEHIENLGIDSTQARIERMKILISKTTSWEQAKELLNETPGGWGIESNSGGLLWQELFKTNPGWIKDIKDEPRARLRLTSQSGTGLWQHIIDGWIEYRGSGNDTDKKLPGISETRALLSKVPLDIPGADILFQKRNQPHNSIKDLFDNSFLHSPSTWVGQADEHQAEKASNILTGLLVGQNKANANQREAWAENAQMLLGAWRKNPDSLTEQTTAVLWCLGQYLRLVEGLKLETDVYQLVEMQDVPIPEAGAMDWAKKMLEERGKPHPTLSTMETVLKRAYLGAMGQQAEETQGRVKSKAPKM